MRKSLVLADAWLVLAPAAACVYPRCGALRPIPHRFWDRHVPVVFDRVSLVMLASVVRAGAPPQCLLWSLPPGGYSAGIPVWARNSAMAAAARARIA